MFRLVAVALLVVSAVTALPSSKIIGEDASIEEFPSQASFFIYGSFICSASIISEKVVLTAGHCILNRIGPSDCNVRVGSALNNEGGQFIGVERLYLHGKSSRFSFDYDIGLVLLKTPIVFDGVTVAPIKFAQSGEPQQGGEDIVGLVAGWETGAEGRKQLRKVSLSVAEHEKCVEVYANNQDKVTERMVCVLVDEENATCTGDKGSALIVDGVLVGLASWATECGNPEYPSVFTDVSTVSDWVLNTLAIIG